MSDLSAGAAFGLSLLIAAIPIALYVVTVWRLDIYEREPLKLLILAFLWGAVPSALLAIIISSVLSVPLTLLPEQYYQMATASLVAPPVEEAIKGLALVGLYLWAREEFDDALDGVIYGSLIGFGFSLSENVLYLMDTSSVSEWAAVAFGRGVIFGLNHAMFTSFTGAALGIALGVSGRGRRTAIVLAGYLLAMGAHFGHNFLLSISQGIWLSLAANLGGVAIILLVVLWSWWRERHWIADGLAPEVSAGILTQSQYEAIRSRRRKHPTGKPDRAWERFYRAAVELAFAKQRQKREHPAPGEQIDALRTRLAAARDALERV